MSTDVSAVNAFVRIVSGGHAHNTHVYSPEGVEVHGINSLHIECDAPGPIQAELSAHVGDLDLSLLPENITVKLFLAWEDIEEIGDRYLQGLASAISREMDRRKVGNGDGKEETVA